MRLRLGFNPHIAPASRKVLHEQLREVVAAAVRLEFQIVELNLSSAMYELGLPITYDSGVIRILSDAPVRFHLNVFPDATKRDWAALTDPNTYSRSIALRRMAQIVEYFEHHHPMEMYVVHPGRQVAPDVAHLDALQESFRTLHSLFPGLPVAVENASEGAVLSDLDSVLMMLEASPMVRFALHTGRAFHAVDADHPAFEARMGYLRHFADRLAEIRWHNTAPGQRPSLPVHLALDRGLDVAKLMQMIGRNPGTVHLIETVGANPAGLVREARALHWAYGV
ncbi:MAG: hypothetical protein FJ029_01910 [Actinobacteria bacterium]|nr:hypothetical protein [Actinomycetota bacterium]